VDRLLAVIEGADHREVGGARIDIVRVGIGRVGRVVYPPGFRWSTHLKPVVGTDLCRHAHVGFRARGRIQRTYRDGCAFDYAASAVVSLAAGHDGWVVGEEEAVLVRFDA